MNIELTSPGAIQNNGSSSEIASRTWFLDHPVRFHLSSVQRNKTLSTSPLMQSHGRDNVTISREFPYSPGLAVGGIGENSWSSPSKKNSKNAAFISRIYLFHTLSPVVYRASFILTFVLLFSCFRPAAFIYAFKRARFCQSQGRKQIDESEKRNEAKMACFKTEGRGGE